MTWQALATLTVLASGTAGGGDNAFFAMDTGTDAQHLSAAAQVAMIEEIGFAGIAPTYTTSEALREMLAELDRHQLRLFAEYVALDLDSASPLSPQILDAINQLQGREALLWLYVTSQTRRPSDPSGDEQAVKLLREVAALAEHKGVRVALYPHTGLWVERVDDAVRLARLVDRKDLGVTFNLCHWLKVDGKELEARLEEARPHLFVVTINGADADGRDWDLLIQPLDRGSFDVGRVLRKLQQMGFEGPIGLQHYGIAGDPRENLRRSMAAWRRSRGL